MKKKRKQCFQLLEVLVAVFILLLCVAPSLKIYVMMFKEQQAVIHQNQRDQFAHLIHAKITEQLYKQQLPLVDLLEAKEVPYEDPDLRPLLDKLGYEAFYVFGIQDRYKPKGKDKPTAYLGKIRIRMSKKLGGAPPLASQAIDSSLSGDMTYTYLAYIDSGFIDKDKGRREEAVEQEGQNNVQKALESFLNGMPNPATDAKAKGKK